MTNFSKVFIGFAALGALASCSNDEPNGGNSVGAEGQTAYLNVTLLDANDLAREMKGDEENPIDGDFVYGDGNESMVNKGRFYFFDKSGNYVGQTTIWDNTNVGSNDANIEFKSPTLVVLENLKSNEYPEYMVTVLNGSNHSFTNDELKNVTLEQFGKTMSSWGTNTENGFVMTSSSYLTEADDVNHVNKYPFATKLDKDNFARTAELAKKANPVEVFVERLAVRVHVASKKFFSVQAFVAGADGDNPDVGNDEAATKLVVRVDGWFINGTQTNAYLNKQLGNWTATSNIESTTSGNWNWNMPLLHRSYWAQGVNYGKINSSEADGLNYFAYSATTNRAGQFDYCNENTSTYADLSANNNGLPNQQKLTSVVLKATVGTADDANGTNFKPLDFVEHNGVYFTKKRFIDYVLQSASASIPYTRKEVFNPDGTHSKWVYTQVAADQFVIDGTNDRVFVTTAEGFPTDIYSDDKGTATTVAAVQQALKDVTANVRTREAKDGMTYYNIPIAHLNSPKYDANGDLTNWQEGSFGVVRNHTYEVKINSIKRLGQGVFNPDSSEDPIKPDPDPKDPNWYLGATINILSWKIVSNNVDL